jgi:hypothetical protein
VTLPLTHTRVNGQGYELSPDSGPPPPSSDTDSGAGDLLLRAKWHAATIADTLLALELGLRLPSGSPEDFRGAGSVGVIPTAVLSRAFGPAAIDVELGVDADGSNVDASRARYRVGGTVNLVDWCGISAELVGSSGFASVRDIVPNHFGFTGLTDPFDVPRTDIIDADFALHVTLLGHLTGFAGVGVPLTSDGLRPNLVPLFGVTGAF